VRFNFDVRGSVYGLQFDTAEEGGLDFLKYAKDVGADLFIYKRTPNLPFVNIGRNSFEGLIKSDPESPGDAIDLAGFGTNEGVAYRSSLTALRALIVPRNSPIPQGSQGKGNEAMRKLWIDGLRERLYSGKKEVFMEKEAKVQTYEELVAKYFKSGKSKQESILAARKEDPAAFDDYIDRAQRREDGKLFPDQAR